MNPTRVLKSLPALQHAQQVHDELAHSDIVEASLERRLTHYTLHFTKYQARLLTSLSDEAALERPLVDSFIIVLAAANAVDLDLQRSWNFQPPGCDWIELVHQYVEVVGKMAKACEAADHHEVFPYHHVWNETITQLATIICALASLANCNLVTKIPVRWQEIEGKLQPTNRFARQPTVAA